MTDSGGDARKVVQAIIDAWDTHAPRAMPHYSVIDALSKARAYLAAPAQAEPREPHCPVCGTHEVSMERTCHNSACPEYAMEATVYEGWRKPDAAPDAQAQAGARESASCKLEPRPDASSRNPQDGRYLDALIERLRFLNGSNAVAYTNIAAEAADAIAALRARAERAEADAERYRFMRNEAPKRSSLDTVQAQMWEYDRFRLIDGIDLDAAIDRARSQGDNKCA